MEELPVPQIRWIDVSILAPASVVADVSTKYWLTAVPACWIPHSSGGAA